MAAAAAVSAVAGPPTAPLMNKKPKTTPIVWSQKSEEIFIDKWGAAFIRIEQGNLSKRHWDSITKDVNESIEEGAPGYTVQQCKSKIDSLKKRYQTELEKKSGTGSVNSQWVHFERIGPYLRKLPKIAGIPGACDDGVQVSQAGMEEEEEEEEREDIHGGYGGYWATVEKEEGGQRQESQGGLNSASDVELPQSTPTAHGSETQKSSPEETSQNVVKEPQNNKRKSRAEGAAQVQLSPVSKFNKLEGINGQGNNSRKPRKSVGDGRLARSFDNFTKVFADVAMKGMQIEQAIAKNKLETTVQLAQMQMTLKTEIAKLRRGVREASEGELTLFMTMRRPHCAQISKSRPCLIFVPQPSYTSKLIPDI